MRKIIEGIRIMTRILFKKEKKYILTPLGKRKVNKLVYVYIYTAAKMLHDGF